MNHTNTIRSYLALGDSYTIGESVAASQSFPIQTVNILREKNIQIKDPDIIAATGWTTANLIEFLDLNPPKNNYFIVSLLIGVNNQYQGKSVNLYNTEFTELLNRAIFYADKEKKHVFVLSIPDYSVTPFAVGTGTAATAKKIDEFNAVNKNIATDAGVHFLDITGISWTAKNNPALIASDGLHPSGQQYYQWSQLLASLILKELK
jgi:lysophospholipase L1-like esterase